MKRPDWTRLAMALSAVTLGLLFLWGQVYPPHNRAASLDQTLPWARWSVVGFLLAGGAIWAVACVHYFAELTWLWWCQRVGALLSGLGYLGYTFALLTTKPGVAITWILTLALALASAGSVIDSLRAERRQRGQIDAMA